MLPCGLFLKPRDVFLFLVDDLNPIEAGRLPDGSPDFYFRGFDWNDDDLAHLAALLRRLTAVPAMG